jgi:peptide/nickel transport system permease protein
VAFFLQRLGSAVLLVWIVASTVFLAIRLVPGDPAELLLSQGGVAPDAGAVAELRQRLGLERPLAVQYLADFRRLLGGDLGTSLQDGSSVRDEIARRLPRTLELIGAAALLVVMFGIPGGLLAAMRRDGLLDRIGLFLSALCLAVPVFVTGTVLVLVFAQTLHWVPAGGYVPLWQDPAKHFTLLGMPALTISLGLWASVFRMTRASVLDVAQRDYVRTARAKGLTHMRVLLHHVLRNALMPVITVLALNLGTLLGGTVLVEYVFNYPGLSGLLVDAVNARDYPEVQGVVLTISVLFVGLNLAVDFLYAALDPRLRRA